MKKNHISKKHAFFCKSNESLQARFGVGRQCSKVNSRPMNKENFVKRLQLHANISNLEEITAKYQKTGSLISEEKAQLCLFYKVSQFIDQSIINTTHNNKNESRKNVNTEFKMFEDESDKEETVDDDTCCRCSIL